MRGTFDFRAQSVGLPTKSKSKNTCGSQELGALDSKMGRYMGGSILYIYVYAHTYKCAHAHTYIAIYMSATSPTPAATGAHPTLC